MEHSQNKITIAIDGYSSCGKSTLAKALSKHLNYIFIDTGAMYRGVTYFALKNGIIDSEGKINQEQLENEIEHIELNFGEQEANGSRALFVNGVDASEAIRSLEISNYVSEIAAIECVRTQLVKQQQVLGENGGVVLDGRDIGTVVFPNAGLKLFITASPEIRAQRRYNELKAKDSNVDLEAIRANLKHRDLIDTTRKIGPLVQATDAIVIDNSDLNQEEQFELALSYFYKACQQNSNIASDCNY
ncbi:MAG: (d)CMP kinase [Fluviicola sp.]|nr:(d)CMP kinase [Fluviicola sp.]